MSEHASFASSQSSIENIYVQSSSMAKNKKNALKQTYKDEQ